MELRLSVAFLFIAVHSLSASAAPVKKVPYQILAATDGLNAALNVGAATSDCNKLSNYLGQTYAYGRLLKAVSEASPEVYGYEVPQIAESLASLGGFNARNVLPNEDLCVTKVSAEKIKIAHELVSRIQEIIEK